MLTNKRVAILVAGVFEQVELTVSRARFALGATSLARICSRNRYVTGAVGIAPASRDGGGQV